MSRLHVHQRDIEIAIEALGFRQRMLLDVADELRSIGQVPDQTHAKLLKENAEALANLNGVIASSRSKRYDAEPTGVRA